MTIIANLNYLIFINSLYLIERTNKLFHLSFPLNHMTNIGNLYPITFMANSYYKNP